MKKNSKGIYKPSYWMASIGPKLLGDPNLSDVLAKFDRSKVTKEKMGEIEDVLADPLYSYETAYSASKASIGLFRWVKAIRDYYYICQEIEPRKNAHILAEKQFKEKNEGLLESRLTISNHEELLTGLKAHQEEKNEIIAELRG